MNRSLRDFTLLLGLSALLAGCLRAGIAPPPPNVASSVAVLPPNNRTGDPLLVAGGSLYEKYIAETERITVPDVLAVEARRLLERRGIRVADARSTSEATKGRVPESAAQAAEIARQGKLEGAVLYLEIRHWEGDAPIHPSYVIAGVRVSILDVASGRVLWSAERRASPVATPGEVTVGSAYVTAARKVMEELLAGK